jgi:hypothetical protein
VATTLGLRQGQRHRLSLDAQLAALTAAGVGPARQESVSLLFAILVCVSIFAQ